jgi:hypothetical protein
MKVHRNNPLEIHMISDPTLTLPLPGEGTVPPPGRGEARRGSWVDSCKILVEMYSNAKRSNH